MSCAWHSIQYSSGAKFLTSQAHTKGYMCETISMVSYFYSILQSFFLQTPMFHRIHMRFANLILGALQSLSVMSYVCKFNFNLLLFLKFYQFTIIKKYHLPVVWDVLLKKFFFFFEKWPWNPIQWLLQAFLFTLKWKSHMRKKTYVNIAFHW